jgi:hypothetical protein
LVALLLIILTGGSAQAASLVLGYGGSLTTSGVGVYPQQASANSERYFRCVVGLAAGTSPETLISLRISGNISGQTQLFPDPNGAGTPDVQAGVTTYIYGGSTTYYVFTIGPYAGRDIYGSPHAPGQVIGQVSQNDGSFNYSFTFSGSYLSGTTVSNFTSVSGTYNTQHDNADQLEWFAGTAAGVDPLGVTDSPTPGIDNGSSSNTFRFRVQYKILPNFALNLISRWGTPSSPPGPFGTFADFDAGAANAVVRGDRTGGDWWIYSPGLANAPPEWSQTHPRHDDYTDQIHYSVSNVVPEVVLILDGDRSRPHYMQREDTSDSNALDGDGIRYFYDLLPTDYSNYMDNLFLFPYDQPGPDPQDQFQSGIRARCVSNNYVALAVGGHTYEFLATDDYSPPDGNRAWASVGRPGDAENYEYVKPVLGGGGQMTSTFVQQRFSDTDGVNGFGYPYNSQDATQYPQCNPMLTAHPYFGQIVNGFARNSIAPGAGTSTITPTGALADPFAAEAGFGPNPPSRITNDDTILPNYVNIQPNTSPTPFRGGKWTQSSNYTLRINYWQSNNVPPGLMQVLIRKNNDGVTPGSWRAYTMEKANSLDTIFTDGCVYQYVLTPDQLPDLGGPGDYNYRFVASDGIRQATFPNRPANASGIAGWNYLTDPADLGVLQDPNGNNDYYAFRVNQPPVLSNQSVTQPSGRTGDNFIFRATYTDSDGEMLNQNGTGDRPFEASIYLDLFGNPQGVGHVSSVTGETTLNYTTDTGPGYQNNELVGYALEVTSGAAVGKSYVITGNTTAQITAAAGTFLTDGVTLGNTFRISNWFHGTMTPEDALDLNYADGKVYRFDSATHVVLGPGTHRYHFIFRDDWGSWLFPDDSNVMVEGEQVRYPFTGEFQGPEVRDNTAPVLKDYRFTPDALTGPDGTTATPFILSVTYKDIDNNPPSMIRLGLDGTAATPDLILPLFKDPNDDLYSDGVVYSTAPVKLAEGQHIFRAQASDGIARYPASTPPAPFIFAGPPSNPADDTSAPLDSAVGPFVTSNTPPTLSFEPTDDGTNPLDPPGLDPNTGRVSTEFTYTIIYTDVDRFAGVAGNPPDATTGGFVKVYIDSTPYDMTKVNPSDNDYTDGATYQFKISGLQQGTPHQYYFQASDGLDLARKPAFAANPPYYDGPVVDEPPPAPQSLFVQDHPADNGGVMDISFNASQDDLTGPRDVTEYRVYRSTTSGVFADPPVLTIPATHASTYAAQDTTATTGVDFYYVVRAWDNTNESPNSNQAGPFHSIDNIAPQPPTNVTVTDPSLGGTLVVSWTKSTDDGAGNNDVTEYLIFRATSPTGFGGVPLARVPFGNTTYNDTTVTDGTDYWYKMRAFDGSNESVDSNIAGPEQSTDTQAPVIDNLFPVNNALDVAPSTNVSFRVSDSGTGVNLATLTTTATIGGNPFDLGTRTVTGNAAAYNVSFNPPVDFPFRAVVNIAVTVSDLAGQPAAANWRFTIAGEPTYTISGRVADSGGTGLAGVRVAAGALWADTDGAGNYTIVGLVNGQYTVKPALSGYAFTPTQTLVTINNASVAGINFVWQPGYNVSGRVTLSGGGGMQGVTVSNGFGTAITDGSGDYQFTDIPAGNYNITPTLSGYMFTPTFRNVTVGPSATNVDFTGQLQTFSISGVITDVLGQRLSPIAVQGVGPGGPVDAITNTAGQYTLSGLLPGTWTVTPFKTEYVFQPLSQEIDVDRNITDVNFVGLPVYSAVLPAGLSFIALPLAPQDPSPLAVFGATPAFRWDPTLNGGSGGYRAHNVVPVPEIMNVRPGRGFWVRPAVPTTLNTAGTPVPRNITQYLSLLDGWNMVGNPYRALLPWANIGVTAGGPVSDYAYIYTPGIGYVLVADSPGIGGVTTISEGAGMWMKSTGSRTVSISPVSGTAAVSEHPAWTRTAGEFMVPIVAQAGDQMDAAARLGVITYAQTHPEAYDIDNPPAMQNSVDVYFTGADGRLLTCDVRGDSAASLTFNFTVRTDLQGVPVKLSLPDLSQVPRDKAVILTDVASGKRLWARTLSSYTYNSGNGGERQFRLEIVPNAGGGLTATLSPATAQAGGVTITYTLSRPASVQMTIMNLAGRTVRTLARDDSATAGLNSAAWDLRSNTGVRVPAGRYLIRLTASAEDGQQVSALAPLMVQ